MVLENLKMTMLVNALSFFKIPLLAFCLPRVLEISNQRSVIKVSLNYRTKNHLGVMYFGALAMGAELSVAVRAVQEIQKSKQRVDFLFKNFQCQFLKRADDDVQFVCEEANAVADLIHRCLQNPDRLEQSFSGSAYVQGSSEPVMTYSLTLSVKHRP